MSFEVTKAVINELQKRKGMMVTISSIYAQKPEKGFGSYVSAKNAVEGLIRSLAVEFPQVNQLIYRPNKFLSDQTITNFSQIHLQNSVEVVKDLWTGLDKLQSESINPLILNQLDAKDIQAVSDRLELSKVKETDQPKIALAATFTAELIEESLNFWLQELSINSQVEFAAYNQVFQQLLDPNSLFANNHQGINVILVRFEDWQRFEDKSEEKTQISQLNPDKIRQTTQDLITALKSAAENSSTPYLIIVCPGSPLVAASAESLNLFQEMENLLESEINYLSSVYLIKSSEILKTYPVENYYDSSGDKLGHIPFTNLFYTSLGTLISRKIYTLKNPPYKVIVLDCDRTLWQGVCGEDGAMGIKIDGPWKTLQEFMVAQYEAGILICLCSKNVEADVIEVFEKRPEMPLKLEHIVSSRINWQPKSENIKSLAAELNLGLDSFIFIDDNPIECSEVQLNCPQVLTLQVPENSEDIPRFLNHVWGFDRLKTTKEDKKRTELYKQNIERESLRSSSLSFQEFLDKLDLNVNITKMQPSQLARVSQLTQRTNQFNATTIRRSETEIKTLCQSQNYECLTVEVKDRFGDYGLVGVIIFQLKENYLIVDTFLLSCRVLGRGVEYQMLAELGKIADENQLDFVDFAYSPSAKNEPLLNFINNVGEKFAQPENDGFIYHFPTYFVKELTYKPAISKNNGEKNQQTTSSLKDTNFSVDNQSKSIQLSRIANELYSAEQIIQIIESQKQDSRNLQQTYVSPRNKTEQELADFWKKLFNIDRVGIYDNFFDVGGNSLVAVRLFSQIEEKFNKSFPLSILLKAPTVEKLAQLIDQKQQNTQQSLLLPIQVGSPEKTPFFAVHGGFGDVLYYQELAKEIGSDQPFYGIQPLGLDGKSSPLAKVEDMAAKYVEEIR
ncbi:MAG: HAD-IIIC family phosphatase, partial [Microcoleaceae cyanobacterium]